MVSTRNWIKGKKSFIVVVVLLLYCIVVVKLGTITQGSMIFFPFRMETAFFFFSLSLHLPAFKECTAVFMHSSPFGP